MIFSYRTRRAIRRFLGVAVVVAVAAVLVLLCWLIWLQRFICYTPDGVVLDFSCQAPSFQGQIPQKPAPAGEVELEYWDEKNEQTPDDTPVVQEKRFEGFYIDSAQLRKDISAVRAQVEKLPAGTPVLLDVKNYWGYFFYSTELGETAGVSYSIEEMNALIAYMEEKDLYAIARLPAFRDYDFAIDNKASGLKTQRGYLWEDEGRCYWLDPTDDLALTYLIRIAKELQGLGFDEVVFQDFRVPENEKIVFEGDRKTALETAADTLVTACATDHFTVSFITDDLTLQLPAKGCRLYLKDVAAENVADVFAAISMTDKANRVVFFAQSNDTRYDVGGVLLPLDLAW